jgi:hypothetical protein
MAKDISWKSKLQQRGPIGTTYQLGARHQSANDAGADGPHSFLAREQRVCTPQLGSRSDARYHLSSPVVVSLHVMCLIIVEEYIPRSWRTCRADIFC